MRSIEYLVQLFPEKTGAEIMEIQKQDKLNDEKEFQEKNKEKLKFIEEININGGFYKGRFGVDQRYYYNVTNLELIDGQIYFDVEKVTVFLGDGEKNDSLKRRSVEYKKKEMQNYDQYMFDSMCERTTKEEWDKLITYIDTISEFWDDIKEVE